MRNKQSEYRVCVRIKGELLEKIKRWKAGGYSLSEILRLALSLLPSSPNQFCLTEPAHLKPIKSPGMRNRTSLKPKDEKDALKELQEW